MSIIGDLFGGGQIADLIKTGLQIAFPDPAKRAEAEAALVNAQNAGAFKQMDQEFQTQMEQIKVNAVEAASPSFWVSGWRPGAGWVGVVSLALIYIPKAIMLTTFWCLQAAHILHAWDGHGPLSLPPYPDLGVTDVLGLLGALLGIGTMRTVEKVKGVAGLGH